MRKMLILPMVLGLCACDDVPIVETDLVCRVYSESMEKSADVEIGFRAYEDYALMSIAGAKEIKIPLVSEREMLDRVILNYYGEQWGMQFELSKELGIVRSFFIHTPEGGPNAGSGCNVPVKYKSDKYVAATELEKCIDYIVNKVYLKDADNPSAGLIIPYEIHYYRADGGWETDIKQFEIPAEEAKEISSNWDYANIKLYSLKDGIQEYEHDACQVQYELMRFMDWQEIRKPRKVYAGETKPEVKPVVAE